MDKAEKRAEAVRRHQRIQAFRHVLRLKHTLKDYLAEAPYGDNLKKIVEEANTALQSAKAARQGYQRDFRRLEVSKASNMIGALLGIGSVRGRSLRLTMGKQLRAEKNKGKFHITVGWMWNHRVYDHLYRGCICQYGDWVILSAKRLRINQRYTEIYEVRAYNYGTDAMADGYVAVAVIDGNRTAFFDKKVHIAAKLANDVIAKHIDKLLEGTTDDQGSN